MLQYIHNRDECGKLVEETIRTQKVFVVKWKTDKKNDGSGENDKCHMTYNIGSVPVALVG